VDEQNGDISGLTVRGLTTKISGLGLQTKEKFMGVHLCNLYEFMPAMVGNKCIKLSLNFIWIKIH
jgi:hypothetical protein